MPNTQHSLYLVRSKSIVALEKGAILVQFALLAFVIVAILGTIQIGYMFYAKRDLQRIADLAAMEATNALSFGDEGTCQAAQDAGLKSIQTQWPELTLVAPTQRNVLCGNWDQSASTTTNSGIDDLSKRFSQGSSTGPVNGAMVQVKGETLKLLPFTGSREVYAEAIATKTDEKIVAFSIATTLVNVGCNQQLAPLIQILNVVGAGNSCVTVSGYEGLVGAKISASGLLKALGVPITTDLTIADVKNLLVAKTVSLGTLLNTALTVGGHSELLDINATIIQLISTKLGIDALNLQIPLLSGANGPGIFTSIHAPDDTLASALDIQLNTLDIITAAIGVGTSGRGVSIPGLNIAIPGILPNLLEVKAGIIEPPSIGIGGIGTTAYNAQIRLYINIDTNGGIVGGLLQLLGTRVKLPIFIDIARAKGMIEDISCKAPSKNSTAIISVDASIAQACIGKVTGNPFSIRTPICESIANETLVSVLGLVRINNQIHINALKDTYLSPELKAGETWTTLGNRLNLGDTLSAITKELLRLIGELLGSPGDASWSAAENLQAAQTMSNYYIGIGSDALPALPTVKLGGLLGIGSPSGAYNTDVLVQRLSDAIDRSGQGCLLGIPLLCWRTNEWQQWGDSVGNVSNILGIGNHISNGSCFSSANGNVTTYNNCIRDQLAQELLKKPASKPKNFLQVLLSPLLDTLSAILNPVGNALAGPILRDLLGIELGLNDVKVISIKCDTAHIVY